MGILKPQITRDYVRKRIRELVWDERRPKLECCFDLFAEFVNGVADRRVPEIDLVARVLIDTLEAELKKRYQQEIDAGGNGGGAEYDTDDTTIDKPLGLAKPPVKRGRPRKVR